MQHKLSAQPYPMATISVKCSAELIRKGNEYLTRNARRWEAETDNGIKFKDNFVELLMLEATGNWYVSAAGAVNSGEYGIANGVTRKLVDLKIPRGKWNYFGGKAVVTGDTYPEDIDTQSIANTVMKPVDEVAHEVLDEILAVENEDGIIPVSELNLTVCRLGILTSKAILPERQASCVCRSLCKYLHFLLYIRPRPSGSEDIRVCAVNTQKPRLWHQAILLHPGTAYVLLLSLDK